MSRPANQKMDKRTRPPYRKLKIFSIDPSLATRLETTAIDEAVIEIPWEDHTNQSGIDGLAPGPVGEYLEVVDHDPASGCFYEPVDLNHSYLLAQNGLDPSDGNPQFHQQMVYAVIMNTIKNFEVALGRKALWSERRYKVDGEWESEYILKLRVYPHALREPNAYYSPGKKALLFGYFPSFGADPGRQLPGGTIFTCLSHDVIAHETTHALLDGMHRRLLERSNPDVLAFHEAFADIVAIFQRFSFTEVVRYQIAKSGGKLEDAKSILAQLALQFGEAIGRYGALRNVLSEEPDPSKMKTTLECHARGSLLVAAVFDAFLSIYNARTADLVRIATQGSGVLPEGALHPDLVNRLASEAAKSARHVLNICIRALDYLPPFDITFGDYLRALITADHDLVPSDELNYRVAFIEAFRRRGIYPRKVRSLSVESLIWDSPEDLGHDSPTLDYGRQLRDAVQDWNLTADRKEIYDKMKDARERIHGITDQTRDYKGKILEGLDFGLPRFEVHSVRPVRRVGPDDQLLMDILIEITQRIPGFLDKSLDQVIAEQLHLQDWSGKEPDFWFRGGCTILMNWDTGRLRYCIYKDIKSRTRYDRQREFLQGAEESPSMRATYFDISPGEGEEVFSFLHRL